MAVINPFRLIPFIVIGMTFYICYKIWKGLGVKSALVWLLTSASIVTWWIFFRRSFLVSNPTLSAFGYIFFTFSSITFALFLAADIIGIALWLLRKTKINVKRQVLFVLSLASALLVYAYFEGANVRAIETTIATDKLPAGTDAVRIVQITDLHIDRFFNPKRLIRAMELTDAAKPDLIVLTGDIVDKDLRGDEYLAGLFRSVNAPLGKFAVTGNHEFYWGFDQSVDFMRRAGYEVLHSDWRDLGPLVIAGVDNPGGVMMSKQNDGFTTLSSIPDDLRDKFILFLKHIPYVHEDNIGLFDLQLSGHTHGGQLWPLRYLVNSMHEVKNGLSVYKDSFLYVSNGVGVWGPPMRFLTPSEVAVINVVRKQPD